jgi:TonB-linked SusC/RagA family outer membrane protein
MRKILPARTGHSMPFPKHLFVSTCCLLLFFHAVTGQEKKTGNVTLHLMVTNRPVSEAFQSIEKQAGVTFHFDKTAGIDLSRPVSLSLEKATLSQVLEALTRQTGYQFRQRGDKILIVGATEPPASLGAGGSDPLNGKVLDTKDQPVQGVSVIVKGTTTGTQTDADGLFSIKATRGNVLVLSFIGYETKEVTVGSAASVVITLEENKKILGEVVVTALGIQRQSKELGYSTAKVSSATINQAKTTNLATGLSGKVSGLQINTADNSVDPSTRIVLRGNRSFLGNNQALLIVDGVQVDLSYINYINPNDVDNVTVLKGANAAALYGSDASNGVLILTTKKGVKGKPSITISSTYTQEKVSFLPDLQNSYGPHAGEYTQGYVLFTDYRGNRSYIPFEQQAQGPAFNGDSILVGFPQRNGEVLRGIYKAYPNAKYSFFNKGHTFQNDISYSAADDKGSYFLSFQDVNTKGTVPDDAARRTGMRFNGSRNYGKFSSSIGLAYNQFNVDQDGDFNSTYTSLLGFPPSVNVPAYKNTAADPNASINGFPIPYSLNPYWYVNNVRNKYRNDNLAGNIDLNFKVLPWLNALYRIGFSAFNTNGKLTTADKTYSNDAILYSNSSFSSDNYIAFSPAPNQVTDDFDFRSRLSTTALITADNSYGRFTSKAIIGYTTNDSYERKSEQTSTSLAFPGFFNIGSGTQSPTLTDNTSRIRTTGAFADWTVGYNDYLFVHGSIRRDQSSLLAEKYRTFYYPGVDVSFIASEAIKALKDSKVLSYAKIRGSITRVGNINIPPYSLQNTFQLANAGANNPNNTGAYNTFPFTGTGTTSYAINQTIYNPLLKPEFTVSKEVGADLGFFNGRVNLQLAYFKENTSNQTVPVQVSPVTGYTTQYINVGEMENKGYEIDLNLTPLIRLKNGLRWNIGANFSYLNNKVISLLPGIDELNISGATGIKQVGGIPLVQYDYAIVGQAFPYLKVQDWVRDPQGRVVVDATTGLPSQDPNPKPYGQLNPKYRLGLNTSVSYKGFTLSGVAEFRAGNVIFNNMPYLDEFGLSPRSVAGGNQRFVYPNSVIQTAPGKYVPNTNVTINDYFQFWGQNGFAYLPPAMFVSSGDFWKLRELALSYEFPQSLVQRVKILKKATASIVGRNLFIWRPKDNQWTDPEYSEDNSNAVGQTSTYQAPPVRSYGLNLTLIF